MPDEVVGDLADGVGGDDGIDQLLERFGVGFLDRRDQIVEADGVGEGDGLAHASTLS